MPGVKCEDATGVRSRPRGPGPRWSRAGGSRRRDATADDAARRRDRTYVTTFLLLFGLPFEWKQEWKTEEPGQENDQQEVPAGIRVLFRSALYVCRVAHSVVNVISKGIIPALPNDTCKRCIFTIYV